MPPLALDFIELPFDIARVLGAHLDLQPHGIGQAIVERGECIERRGRGEILEFRAELEQSGVIDGRAPQQVERGRLAR